MFVLMSVRILCILSIGAQFLAAQNRVDTAAIRKELSFILERDQKARKTDSVQFVTFIDSSNLVKVERIIEQLGWPGRSAVGATGNYASWLVIQHADLKTQEKYLPMLRASVELKESRPVDLAYLEDRVLMRQGKEQLYGTQISINPTTGAQEIWPISDEANLDSRRAKLGMEPMAEYARHFGIDYRARNDR